MDVYCDSSQRQRTALVARRVGAELQNLIRRDDVDFFRVTSNRGQRQEVVYQGHRRCIVGNSTVLRHGHVATPVVMKGFVGWWLSGTCTKKKSKEERGGRLKRDLRTRKFEEVRTPRANFAGLTKRHCASLPRNASGH